MVEKGQLDLNQEKYYLDRMSKMRWNERHNIFLKKILVDSDQAKCDLNHVQNLIWIK